MGGGILGPFCIRVRAGYILCKKRNYSGFAFIANCIKTGVDARFVGCRFFHGNHIISF